MLYLISPAELKKKNLRWTECDLNSPYLDRVDGQVVKVSHSVWINYYCFLQENLDRVWFRPPRHRVWEAAVNFHENQLLLKQRRTKKSLDVNSIDIENLINDFDLICLERSRLRYSPMAVTTHKSFRPFWVSWLIIN